MPSNVTPSAQRAKASIEREAGRYGLRRNPAPLHRPPRPAVVEVHEHRHEFERGRLDGSSCSWRRRAGDSKARVAFVRLTVIAHLNLNGSALAESSEPVLDGSPWQRRARRAVRPALESAGYRVGDDPAAVERLTERVITHAASRAGCASAFAGRGGACSPLLTVGRCSPCRSGVCALRCENVAPIWGSHRPVGGTVTRAATPRSTTGRGRGRALPRNERARRRMTVVLIWSARSTGVVERRRRRT